MEFQKKSYELHSVSYKGKVGDLQELELYRNWFSNGTIDTWRHLRMLDVLNPFLDADKGSTWLTVGDGRFGTSAIYINKHGGHALPSDIDDTLLKISKENGMIDDYRKENAESMSFADESFDYAFCKEAYHHFPRPYSALYEMLRVARKAIIFSEPKDWIPPPVPLRILQIVKNKIKVLLGMSIPHPDEGNYEEIGNYIYSISEREFHKVGLGLALPMVAFKDFYDIYLEGVENELIENNSRLFRKIKRGLLWEDIKYWSGFGSRNRVSAIIFKVMPSDELLTALKKARIRIYKLPKNNLVSQ